MSPEQHPSTVVEGSSGSLRKAGAEAVVKCPRCDSPNTKFCYYNNYSLTQPRHFCKTCRRYWTKGGALRNVPIGGGCRKNKKLKPSSSSSSLPAMDFQNHLYSSSGNGIASFGLDTSLMPINYHPPLMGHQQLNTTTTNLASSIESLSCINQDLHWKLQQQRLAVLFGNNNNMNKDHQNNNNNIIMTQPVEQHHQQQEQEKQGLMRMQPILFQNLDISGKEAAANADVATEWFFGNSYNTGAGGDHRAPPAHNWTTTAPNWSNHHDDLNHYSANLP